jgi:hypothetical protein
MAAERCHSSGDELPTVHIFVTCVVVATVLHMNEGPTIHCRRRKQYRVPGDNLCLWGNLWNAAIAS